MLFFDSVLVYIKEFISLIGVTVITFGAIRSVYQLFFVFFNKNYTLDKVRLQFLNSVLLGLEFIVGADIISSLINPNYYSLGPLAVLVLIRTTLSYFLSLELRALSPEQRKVVE